MSAESNAEHTRAVTRGLKTIRSTANRLGLTESVTEESVALFKQRVNHDEPLEGYSIARIAGACLLTACYRNDVGIPNGAIEQAFDVDNVAGAYRRLNQRLDIQILPAPAYGYIPYMVRELNLDGETANLAEELVDTLHNPGKNGAITAATAVYLASRRSDQTRLSIEAVAEAAHVSTVGVRNRAQDNADKLQDTEVCTPDAVYRLETPDGKTTFPVPVQYETDNDT